MRWICALTVSVMAACGAVAAEPDKAGAMGGVKTKALWLDELDMRKTTCGWQQTLSRRSVGGSGLKLRGKTYERGVGTHAPGQITVALDGQARRFTAVIGIDDESNGAGSAEFIIYADKKQVYHSGRVTGRDPVKEVAVDLTGVKQLDLVVTVAGDGYGNDHTDWAEAKFVLGGDVPNTIRPPQTIKPPPPPPPAPMTEWEVLNAEIDRCKGLRKQLEPQTFHPASLIEESDRDALDVVLRRTAALLAYLKKMDGVRDLSAEQAALARLADQCHAAGAGEVDARKRMFSQAVQLRRKIAFANPLLNFDKLVFIKKHFYPPSESAGNHMCDQYFGFMAIHEGGLYVLENPFSQNPDKPTVRDVLADSVCQNGRFQGKKLVDGGFQSPDLSYDGKRIIFCWTEGENTKYIWTQRSTYHLFSVNVDGSDLRQLTDGPFNDLMPCWMPNGRVAFMSERRGGYGRCHGRPVPSFTLHSMFPDGSDIVCLSPHETNEWNPSIDNDGMIIYTRWDYVDRGFNQAHHPWITTPDGRDARAIQGNFDRQQGGRPHMEQTVRAIPGSHKLVATACGHHGQIYGSLIIVDPLVEDDNLMSATRRFMPEIRFYESEGGPQHYATPWPLSEYFHLCMHDPEGNVSRGPGNNFGIYLVDAFGNRELIYRDPNISCLYNIPLRARPVPPVVPQVTLVGRPKRPDGSLPPQVPQAELPKTAQVNVINVYDGELPWPEGTKITHLRIMQLIPKTTPIADNPRIGYGAQKGARAVLGTVPVEADGSASFLLPVGIPVYFQALDANGLAVQSMRSATYVHPGEKLTCHGCHDRRWRSPAAPARAEPLALRREPSAIQPDAEGSRPFSFPRLVQPVLDKHCVDCHAKNKDKKAPDLAAGDVEHNGGSWYPSYANLQKFAFYFNDPVWTTPQTIPGKFGAKEAKLYQMLRKGHHDVKLPAEDLHRITLWLDCNSDFFGSFQNTKEQARGEIVQPSLE